MQSSAVSKHCNATCHNLFWNEVKSIDCDLHWYTRRVKEHINKRIHLDNINRDSGIEIPVCSMPSMCVTVSSENFYLCLCSFVHQ